MSESSSLSSTKSMSPLLDYPSPVSSQDHSSRNSSNPPNPKKRALDDDEVPIAKKRRKPEQKPRTTEFLDLSISSKHPLTDQKAQLDTLLKVLRKRRKIVVVAGAGISVSAGGT